MNSTARTLLRDLKRQLGKRSVDLGSALDEIRWAVAETLEADRATLYLVDHVRGELVSRSTDLPGINRIRLKIGEGLAGEVARVGRPLRLSEDEQRTEAAKRLDGETGYRTRTMIAVPIHVEGRVAAVLQVLNKLDGDFNASDEAELLDLSEPLADVLATSSLGSQLAASSRRPLQFQFNRIVGDAAGMRELYDLITRAAATDITVLVRGESGTGKNLAAQAIHDNSSRREGPFVVVDCAAIPENLLENELFGHEAGAYTGADKASPGKVGVANGGTLFLDEVGELSLQAQKKLLRLLQDRTYYPVGATQPRTADVRFVCATNRDLEQAVAEDQFRQDLLYRLRVVELRVPSLRERGADDLDRLIDHYVFEHARRYERPDAELTEAARRKLHGYPWPGNVRELRHVLEAGVVLAASPLLDAADIRLPNDPRPAQEGPDGFRVPEVLPLRDMVSAYAHWSLDRHEGNRSATARALGVSRNTLASYLEREIGSG